MIASALLEELTEEMPDWYDSMVKEVAFIWIAPNKLHEQSYFKMKNFFSTKKLLHTMRWDEMDHTLDYLRHGDILFLNWESINKDNALIMRESESHRTLIEIAARTQLEHNIPIIVIIDEEHMFAGRNAKKAQRVLEQAQPKDRTAYLRNASLYQRPVCHGGTRRCYQGRDDKEKCGAQSRH